MKNTTMWGGGLLVVLIIVLGVWYWQKTDTTMSPVTVTPTVTPTSTNPVNNVSSSTAATSSASVPFSREEEFGRSVNGVPLVAHHFGTGTKEIVLIGGIHGGYSPNSSLLGYELIDWYTKNPGAIASDITLTIIPVLNPDGLKVVTGTTGRFTTAMATEAPDLRKKGRFNANNVDLNRNFACEWNKEAKWQEETVSGGATVFSEPESQAIKAYVEKTTPEAIVTWYSAAGGVYGSACGGAPSKETTELSTAFAKAATYEAFTSFDYYSLTGDMVNWFASKNIPAFSVLLTDHTNTEFSKNLAGVEAVMKQVGE